MQERPQKDLPSLTESATLEEQPFRSETPLIGPLIVAVRTLWNSISTKWYARPLLLQQSTFNLDVARRVEALETYAYEQISRQDRDLVALRREKAELEVTLARLRDEVQVLQERLGETGEARSDKQGAGGA